MCVFSTLSNRVSCVISGRRSGSEIEPDAVPREKHREVNDCSLHCPVVALGGLTFARFSFDVSQLSSDIAREDQSDRVTSSSCTTV